MVSGATVTVKSVDTGAVRTTSTDGSGLYRVLSLPVGEYEIRAQKPGFTDAVRTGVHLVVGQNATVDLGLSVGGEPRSDGQRGRPLVSVAPRTSPAWSANSR